MKMGPLIALLTDFIAVPNAWVSAAVAYTLLLLTVLLRTDACWTRGGPPEVLKALLPALEDELRGSAQVIWCLLPGLTATEPGVSFSILLHSCDRC